ncbi:MAG: sulfur carrier protein ThiS [bacterium]
MNIIVNGESMSLEREMTIADLLEHLGRTGQSIALAVNMEFVPHSAYASARLKDGDEIEIVEPRQGG